MKTIILILLFAILFSGCVGKEAGHNATSGELPVSAETLVDLAKKDLAEKSNTTIGDIKVVGLTPVEWPDTSLGYPEPGKMYAQVITPGYVIMLSANNSIFEYHSDYERVVPPHAPKP